MKIERKKATDEIIGNDKVNPYSDWERETRPAWRKKEQEQKDEGGLWQPVYVEFTPKSNSKEDIRDGLQALEDARGEDLKLPSETLWMLKAIDKVILSVDGSQSNAATQRELEEKSERYRRFFVFRREQVAYETSYEKDGNKVPLPYKVRHVGTAIPEAVATSLSTNTAVDIRGFPIWAFQALISSQWASPTLIDRYSDTTPPVITGAIDGVIGFANERFRKPSDETPTGETRIKRFWAQGVPTLEPGGDSGDDAVVLTQSDSDAQLRRPFPFKTPESKIGAVLSAGEINEMLRDNPDEVSLYQQFYDSMGVPVIPSNREQYETKEIADRAATYLKDPAFRRAPGFQWTHGTHVLDLAAGYPCEDNVEDRPIMAVQLPELATLESWGARLDLYILLAAQRLIAWADEYEIEQPKSDVLEDLQAFQDGEVLIDRPPVIVPAPLVVNISYGVAAGPKDGNGFIERELARLAHLRTKDTPEAATFFVFPSGNFFRSQTHAAGVLRKGKEFNIDWRLQPSDRSVSFLEIWLRHLKKAKLELTFPDGTCLAFPLEPCFDAYDIVRARAEGEDPVVIGRVYQQEIDGRVRVIIALCPTLNDEDTVSKWVHAGAYHVCVRNTGNTELSVTFDVQRDDTPSLFPMYGRQSYLESEDVNSFDPETHDWSMPRPNAENTVMRERTLSAFSTGPFKECVVVGGAFDRDAYAEAALSTSSGPVTRRAGPDLSAVSDETRTHSGRLATGFFSGSSALASGTSVAAPDVTRRIVDALSAGVSADKVLSKILGGGKVNPSQDARLGHGVVKFGATEGRQPRRWPN